MGCDLTPKRMELPLFVGNETTDQTDAPNRLYVLPGSPLVWMHVAIYFRAQTPGYVEPSAPLANNVTVTSFVRDPIQGSMLMAEVVTESATPFTWEGVTGADGVRFLVQQQNFGAVGNLIAVVTFHPASPMSVDMWEMLRNRATAYADAVVTQQVSL